MNDAQTIYALDDFMGLSESWKRGKDSAIDAAVRWADGESIAYADYHLPDPGEHDTVPRPSLVLYGVTGTGKTTLANAAFRTRLEREGAGIRIEFLALSLEIQRTYSNSDDSSALIKAAQTAPLLLLDDLGDIDRSRMESDDKRRILYLILNDRVALGLPTIITTNLYPDETTGQFGARIAERLLQMAVWVPMDVPKLRPGVPSFGMVATR